MIPSCQNERGIKMQYRNQSPGGEGEDGNPEIVVFQGVVKTDTIAELNRMAVFTGVALMEETIDGQHDAQDGAMLVESFEGVCRAGGIHGTAGSVDRGDEFLEKTHPRLQGVKIRCIFPPERVFSQGRHAVPWPPWGGLRRGHETQQQEEEEDRNADHDSSSPSGSGRGCCGRRCSSRRRWRSEIIFS